MTPRVNTLLTPTNNNDTNNHHVVASTARRTIPTDKDMTNDDIDRALAALPNVNAIFATFSIGR